MRDFVKNYQPILHASVVGHELDVEKQRFGYLELLGFKLEGIMSTSIAYLLPVKDKMSTQHYFFSVKLKIDPEGFACVVEKMPRVVSLKQLSITNLWNSFLNCSDQRFEERLECNFTDADMPSK
ncbi:hypothetical protein HID58_043728 [Brassica napus]|uniref:Uncharacterized protein n=1 Tax=Brassica napus TaxID=3708 RepID=A0ABQ8BIY6_BRANA|nr:hypothetical protein HID58_043728 [Brassica napus]